MILRSLICPEFGILGSGFFRSKACILATAPVKASWKYNVCGSRNHLGNLQVCWVCWLNACFWVVHFRDDWRAGETHDVHFSDSAIGSFLDILVHAVCPGFGGCWDIRLFLACGWYGALGRVVDFEMCHLRSRGRVANFKNEVFRNGGIGFEIFDFLTCCTWKRHRLHMLSYDRRGGGGGGG